MCSVVKEGAMKQRLGAASAGAMKKSARKGAVMEAMKTAKMKELVVKAFLNVIKKGGLFGAFLNAQGRMILNAKLQKDFQEKSEAYLKNTKDKRLLQALEELEGGCA